MSLRVAQATLPSWFGILLIAMTTLVTAEATAAGPSSRRARVLFDQARELAKQARYAEACPKFVESYQLDGGVGTEFNLADCWEHVGKRELARTLFIDVAQKSREAGQAERAALARQRAAALLSPPPTAAVAEAPAAPEPKVEVVPDVVVAARAPALEHAKTQSEAPLPVKLRDEYSTLADASSRIQELRLSLAALARTPQHAARARALVEKLATAQRELDESIRLAGQVAALALRQTEWARRAATPPLKADREKSKPRVAGQLATTAAESR